MNANLQTSETLVVIDFRVTQGNPNHMSQHTYSANTN